jgi:XTP/dITP diphosphohydrolase
MNQPAESGSLSSLPRLVLATTNAHKIEELRTLLATARFAVVDPGELGLDLDVPETGDTFAANAAIKALAWARAAGMLALADDSGLEIDALDGEPGLYSARWAGPTVPYSERNRLLIARLADLRPNQRTARYRCAVAVADADRVLVATEGVLEGRIAETPRGSGGFGYDPIFEVPLWGRTVGELTAAEKHQISHRARAIAAALPGLASLSASAVVQRGPAPRLGASAEEG